MITIFYGMSGSLKLTTMTRSRKYKNDFKIYSDVKPHYEYINRFFKGIREPSDLDFAIHRLLTLKTPGLLEGRENISIERGISDFLQCYINRPETNKYLDLSFIPEVISEERKILSSIRKGEETRKILLVMLDKNFIKNTILLEPTRKIIYENVDYYLERQRDYVKFTETYNNISEVIEITNAIEYLNNLK